MIDLHVHSTFSDGTMVPTDLVDYAMNKGLSAFALTDHDTVLGIDEAMDYAHLLNEMGVENVPKIIPGIELSTDWNGQEVHIVGLYINHKAQVFQTFLDDFIRSREVRNEKMCQKLTEMGMPVSYEELKNTFPTSVITRAHMAAFLVNNGYVKNRQDAFAKYLGDHCPCYVHREKVDPFDAIKLILDADGIPILAHPILYHLSDSRLDELVSRLKNAGLIGIEAVYSTYAPAEERQIRSLANKYHLLLSGGSDFHGANKPHIDLGIGMGKLNVPDEFLDRINESRKNLLFTDMDGTLLKSDNTISESLKNAIDAMTANGHSLILTSGRPLPSILEVKVKLGLNYPNMYIISNNGGLIYDCEQSRPVLEKKVSSEVIRKVVSLANRAGIHVHSYTATDIVGFSEDEEVKYYRSRIHMPFIQVDDIAGYLKDGAYKVQLIHLTDRDELEKLRLEIVQELGNEVDAFFSNDQYLEILPKGINKGDAVLFLEKHLAVPHSHTFAAGDADNDLSMINAAGTGIAMKNASKEIKEAADIITANDNDHDGLLEIISKHFM